MALSVNHFVSSGEGLLDERPYVTIVADGGDDLYVQQVPPAVPGQADYVPALIYANNASFLNHGEILDINQYDQVLATNGTFANNTQLLDGSNQDSNVYPFNPNPKTARADQVRFDTASFESTFVLTTDDIDATEDINGILNNGVGGRWAFENTPGLTTGLAFFATDFSPIGLPSGPNPVSARVISRGQSEFSFSGDFDLLFVVTWDSNSLLPGGLTPQTPPVLEEIHYDFDDDPTVFRPADVFDIEASSPYDPSFTLPIPAALPADQQSYELVDGSLTGTVTIAQWGGQRFEFRTAGQFPEDDPLAGGGDLNVVRDELGFPVLNPAGEPLRESTLVFRSVDDPGAPWRTTVGFETDRSHGTEDGNGVDIRWMSGKLTYVLKRLDPTLPESWQPTVSLQFNAAFEFPEFRTTSGGGASGQPLTRLPIAVLDNPGDRLGVQEVGRVTVDASYALYAQPTQFVGGNFTFFDGQTFTRSLTVDLLSPGATISIESDLIFNEADPDIDPLQPPLPGDDDYDANDSPANHFFDFRASNTFLEAQMRSGTSFNLRNSQYGQALSERLIVNAANAARTYDIRVWDDPRTDNYQRSTVFVSSTGSLAGELPTSPNAVPVNAESLYVVSHTGDVLVEGSISAKLQSYILHSPMESTGDDDPWGQANRAPYYFSTQAQISGANTGLLRGEVLAVTLGNDTPTFYDDTANGGSTAFNIVTLQTEVDSVRIQAADRAGNPLQIPFPYDWLLEDRDELRIDAVAASSLPIVIRSGDDMIWNATLLSASDVTASAATGDLDLNAPLTTTFGRITLEADRLSVRNSVRVLDTLNDEASFYDTDIVLTARNGDLLLTGPISAINTIELNQSHDEDAINSASISGPTRVISGRLIVRAEGSVDIRTDVDELTGSAGNGWTVDELNSIYVNEISSANGYVAVTARGFDPVDAAGNDVAALRAVLIDATTIVSSAPNGSVDVRFTNADSVTMGSAAAIVSRRAESMLAAGSVYIESAGGDIRVLDAPVAGSGAVLVRLATKPATEEDPDGEVLAGTYRRRTPGTFADTLTGLANGELVFNRIDGDPASGVKARVRDVVLLTSQEDPRENGIYSVVSPGSAGQPWVLARSAMYDQTSEVPVNLRMRVTEGSQAGSVFRVERYEPDVFELNDDEVIEYTERTLPRAVHTVTNRFGAIEVRAVSTAVLPGTFLRNGDRTEILGLNDGSIPLFDGVPLNLGDLVLVRMGTVDESGTTTMVSNGVYTVSNVGSALSAYVLTESDLVDPDRPFFVKSAEGSLRAKITGSAFEVYPDALGTGSLTIVKEDDARLDDESEDATVDEDATLFTRIGSKDLNDTVRFVVSTNLGTNVSTGSLGKMLWLYNDNSFYNAPDPDFAVPDEPVLQAQSFGFASTLGGPVQLTQELPQISRRIDINSSVREALGGAGSSEIVVDGSRIRQNRDWSLVEGADRVQGFEFFKDSADARLGDASGSSLKGVSIGGFGRGAGVRLVGADDIRVENVVLGKVQNGLRLANNIGIEVTAGSRGLNTILGTGVYASTVAGIKVEGEESGVRVVGSTVGQARFENTIGVDLLGGDSQIGIAPANVTLKRVAAIVSGPDEFFLPASYVNLSRIRVGMAVSSVALEYGEDDGVVPVAQIESISDPYRPFLLGPQDNILRVRVVIRNGLFPVGESDSPVPVSVDFGSFTRFVAGSKEIPLPTGSRIEDIYLGQSITALGLAARTVITAARFDDDLSRWMLTLSNAPSSDADSVQVTLGSPGRNTISHNSRSVVLRGGTNTVYNSTIANSVFDGIVVSGGTQTIGGPSWIGMGGRPTGKDLAIASNAIFGNGSAGIRVSNPPGLPAPIVVIRGNRVGVTDTGAANANKAGNIVGPTSSGFYGPVTGFFANDFNSLASVSWSRSGAGLQTLSVTFAEPHGLTTGDVVRLRVVFSGSATAAVDADFAITSTGSNQFTVALTKPQAAAFGTRKTGGVEVTRVRARIQFSDPDAIQMLPNGHYLWLRVGGTDATPAAQGARKIQRVDTFGDQSDSNTYILVDGFSVVGGPSATVRVDRYGRQSVPFASHLIATNQLDFEGNLHGVPRQPISTGGPVGGVVTAPNPILRPPRRR